MMDQAIKMHKETTFGRLILIQQRAAACKAWLGRVAREQAAEAAKAAPRRHLAPR